MIGHHSFNAAILSSGSEDSKETTPSNPARDDEWLSSSRAGLEGVAFRLID